MTVQLNKSNTALETQLTRLYLLTFCKIKGYQKELPEGVIPTLLLPQLMWKTNLKLPDPSTCAESVLLSPKFYIINRKESVQSFDARRKGPVWFDSRLTRGNKRLLLRLLTGDCGTHNKNNLPVIIQFTYSKNTFLKLTWR